ncbi:dienelactone hydrolase family protein [Actinosynnema sp. NPDC023658]|uniref:dienelactone hydrolase family protein n=1 Tax=Actinosynnema sp. NPDC023658 TaxID=3155465 RepID=UPI0033DBB535
MHLHVADPDPLVPPVDVAAWQTAVTPADRQVFTYPGAGHFYTDADSPDHDEQAADLTWRRVLTFLDALDR